ncbi:DUF3427 domain-containing protein [Vagococcus luciliae]|uniref:UvrABC system protein B n=1 Tax=Vagococcus luciliae TaxID=2920380 RepID=A0ABY5NXK5_9ENTE|nr:DEAD/DEAH box helicase [Vagococcus luciliae]UUV98166.1 UvrABC system protein B [Vagococcus luciliae]
MDDTLLDKALKKAFVDKTVESQYLNPKFIVNDKEKKEFLLSTIQQELVACQSFILSVAFITQSGLNTIKAQLADLAKQGVKGRVLTSTYLGFNNPDVFLSLLEIPNIEVRLSQKEGFHSKGYLFSHSDYQTFIIGSSNLTMNALKLNYEWNIKLTSKDNGDLISTINNHLEKEWEQASILTKEWIRKFSKNYQPLPKRIIQNRDLIKENTNGYIFPNSMQKEALDSLDKLRKSGANKGLIISATGTGKTYLAAFDVAKVKPKRFLFIVHREQILNNAIESFKKVVGGDDSDYGILSGQYKDLEAKYLFSTIQTISKKDYQDILGPDAFDYILIDEVHKAGATSYINTINYFQPTFLLGMTATPERTDGFNIFELFDYNVAYEIRLQDALEEDLLCPFHYFGVTDYEKNGLIINETTDLSYLTYPDRVDFLIEKINYYGCSGNIPKGLVFCSRKEEAKQLALLFKERGIPSDFLSGEDTIAERERVIELLENGTIHYIFTVDIFNEGIDIPKINQVIMLRNTESNIIFIQQLGRGLRKDDSKEFVTVIDFIGNYQNNYMIPMALSGDSSRNKNNLRRDTIDVNYLSGLSAINFEKVAKDRIFKSIDAAKLNSLAELRKSYQRLKNRLNRIPMLYDFEEMGELDPLVVIQREKTYNQFLDKMKESYAPINDKEQLALKFVSIEFLFGGRPHELLVLKECLKNNRDEIEVNEIKELWESKGINYNPQILHSVMSVLDLSFYESGLQKSYMPAQLVTKSSKGLELTLFFKEAKKNDSFILFLKDVIDTGLKKLESKGMPDSLQLYSKYRRKDVLRLLNMKFNQNEQGIGGYTYNNNQFVIFVTLDKGKDFKASLMAYEDEFIDEQTFHWFTKSPRTIDSPEVKILRDSENWTIHLFIKRKYNQQDRETDFYYVGEMNPIIETIEQNKKPTSDNTLKNVVEMDFLLKNRVEPNMYEFLTGNLD